MTTEDLESMQEGLRHYLEIAEASGSDTLKSLLRMAILEAEDLRLARIAAGKV